MLHNKTHTTSATPTLQPQYDLSHSNPLPLTLRNWQVIAMCRLPPGCVFGDMSHIEPPSGF